MAEEMSVGIAYAYGLLETWNKIRELANEVRSNHLLRRNDGRKVSELVALMCDMGIELSCKTKDREDLGDISKQFDGFRKDFAYPPSLYLDVPRRLKLYNLERRTLEKLKILEFEGGG